MLNLPLFRENVRTSRKAFLILSGILVFAVLLNVGLYHPGVGNGLFTLFKYFPEPVLKMLGINDLEVSLIGVLGSTLYGFWFLLIPLLLSIWLTRHLLMEPLEKGSMIYELGALGDRKKVIFTKGYVIGFGLFLLILTGTVAGILFSELLFPGELEIPQFLLMNMSVFFLQFFLSGLMFLCACIGLGKRGWTRLGIWIYVVFFVFYLLGKTGGVFSAARYLTVFSLFDAGLTIEGDLLMLLFLILLFVLGLVCYGAGMTVFGQQDLVFQKEKDR